MNNESPSLAFILMSIAAVMGPSLAVPLPLDAHIKRAEPSEPSDGAGSEDKDKDKNKEPPKQHKNEESKPVDDPKVSNKPTSTEKKTEPTSKSTTKKESSASPTHEGSKKPSESNTQPTSNHHPSKASTTSPSSSNASKDKSVATPSSSSPSSSSSSSSESPAIIPPPNNSMDQPTNGLPTQSSVDADKAEANPSSGPSGGAIGGIVAAVIIAVAGLAAFVVLRRKKRAKALRARMSSKPDPFTMGFGSHDPPPIHDNPFPPHTAYTASMTTPLPQTAPQLQFSAPPTEPMSSATAMPPVASVPMTAVTGVGGAAATAATATGAMVAAQQPPAQATQPGSLGVFTVISTYTPTLSDEVDIQPGDQVEVLVEYDDGWCQGINLSRGHVKGVFPKHCVDYATTPSHNAPPPNDEADRMKRVSSMYMATTTIPTN